MRKVVMLVVALCLMAGAAPELFAAVTFTVHMEDAGGNPVTGLTLTMQWHDATLPPPPGGAWSGNLVMAEGQNAGDYVRTINVSASTVDLWNVWFNTEGGLVTLDAPPGPVVNPSGSMSTGWSGTPSIDHWRVTDNRP